jgi:hypothetical protein
VVVLVTPASLQMWESPEDMDLNEVSECLVSQRIVFHKDTCVIWLLGYFKTFILKQQFSF